MKLSTMAHEWHRSCRPKALNNEATVDSIALTVMARGCMKEGLVRGEGFAIDASVIKADANRAPAYRARKPVSGAVTLADTGATIDVGDLPFAAAVIRGDEPSGEDAEGGAGQSLAALESHAVSGLLAALPV